MLGESWRMILKGPESGVDEGRKRFYFFAVRY